MNKKIFFVLFVILSFNFGLKSQEQKEFNEEASIALVDGARFYDTQAMKDALKKGADINYNKLYTPLYVAIHSSQLDNIKFLLFNGADINIAINLAVLDGVLRCTRESVLNYSDFYSPAGLRAFNTKEKLIVILDLLEKHQARLKNFKNKNLSDIVKKVNAILSKIKRDKIDNIFDLPTVLEDLILGYCDLFPEDFESFSQLSDQAIDEMLKIYFDAFEKKETNQTCLVL